MWRIDGRRVVVASRWARVGITARQLGEHLLLATSGIKASVSSSAKYRDRMAVAVELVVRGGPVPAAPLPEEGDGR
ncbi:hypothetical protein ASF33_07245 [Methylobacterium sp. Leaf92]|nr:hypothetical protein ASF33_07245 [Methylobacterium sp. Leaf92]